MVQVVLLVVPAIVVHLAQAVTGGLAVPTIAAVTADRSGAIIDAAS
jgi:hypothetical protein